MNGCADTEAITHADHYYFINPNSMVPFKQEWILGFSLPERTPHFLLHRYAAKHTLKTDLIASEVVIMDGDQFTHIYDDAAKAA